MSKLSRRAFLKGSVATGVGLTFANGMMGEGYIYPDYEALAASTAPEEVKYTHCVMCNHVPKCGMKIILKEGKILRVEEREDYPNNNLCAKGIASLQEVYDPNRLLHPMKRTTPKGSEDPKWEQITWDEALETIAANFNKIKEEHGADKVLFMTGDPKEPRAAIQRLAYTFGSANYGTESSTCATATWMSSRALYGTPALCMIGGNPTEETGVALVWATNPAWSGPYVMDRYREMKEKNDGKYIVIDPRVTPTVTQLADVHLQLRPGTDAALAFCFGNYLIENDAHDKEFAENWIHGFEEYKEYVKEFTIEKTAEICNLPIDKLTEACEILANRTGPIVPISSAAVPHHTNGMNDYTARIMLIALTGSVDVPGGVPLPPEPLPFDPFMGLPGFNRTKDIFPEIEHFRADKDAYPVWAAFEKSIQLNNIPEYVKDGKLKACLMLGGNANMWPQSQEYQQAFEDMDFVVAADMYINPWTHDYVDMLLPAAISWERSAPLALFGRDLYLREAVVEPAGEARPDFRICCDIGTALGYEEEFFGGGPDSEKNCLKAMLEELDKGVTYEDLLKASPGPVNIPLENKPQLKKYELGLLRKDGKPGFETPTGKVEFTSEIVRENGFNPLPTFVEPVYSPVSTPDIAKDFPLIMNSGSRVPTYTHSKQRDLPWLKSIMPEPILRLHPIDAEERGLTEGDMVKITSPVNSQGIKAKLEITSMLKPGMIDMIHGWKKSNINLLIARDFDKLSGFPPYKEGLCQVEKA